ncbi:MAG: AraC family transcriptional regulator [Candidatus Dormibacteria bacterium]|jgi:AraC-like DNA-binding protein
MSEALDGDSVQARDVLSVLLRTVRLRGEEVLSCAPASPFAISFDHPGGTIHIVSQGELDLQLDGDPATHHYRQGDVFMLPVGRPHVIRHGRRLSPRRLAALESRVETFTHAEGTRWLAGRFSADHSRAEDLLHRLPPVVELRGARDPSLVGLQVATQMLMREMVEPTQGSREMISRILDLMFIQVLRAWATSGDATPGWLTGAMDPVVGDALTAIHANPAHRWTIEGLARRSHLSRSAFADRFSRRVGEPPATYLAELRLASAANLLRDTHEPVNVVAAMVGYESEAAFSRAFSRRFRLPPSRWRREQSSSRQMDSLPASAGP